MPYLTLNEYVARFGDQETARLTNKTPPVAGQAVTYDSAAVEAAIGDAEEVVESYIGSRYVTPISSPPRIVKGWVAALAREALHVNTGKVNEAVDGAAARTRAQLKDVASGTMSLPIEEGGAAPTVKSAGEARSSMDRPSATFSGGGALDAFTAPLQGGFPAGAWRGGA